ncbi:MAG: class I SAM-dependent methyltransferase [Leptospirillia bacterium]
MKNGYSPQSSLWEKLFAAVYDPLLRSVESRRLSPLRGELLRGIHGTILDLGSGTGANLPFLSQPGTRTVFLEISWPMIVKGMAKGMGRSGHVVRGSATSLPFGDQSFDSCVSALVLCSVSDPEAALWEIRRVLRPGGTLFMMEHVLSGHPPVATLQRMATPLWKRMAGGCHLDRDTDRMASGIFDKKEEWTETFSGIPFRLGRYLNRGTGSPDSPSPFVS